MDRLATLQKLAKKSNLLFQMSAIIYRDRWTLGTGYNYRISTATNKRFHGQHSIHAEAMCLSRALHQHGEKVVSGSKMVVYRLSKNGMANSKPCEECKKMLDKYGIEVEYVFEGKWHVR